MNKSKSLQSRVKELIQTWARCIVTWKKDITSILTLLENLRRQQDTAISVGRVLDPLLPAPSPLLQHPFLKSKLHSKLVLDMESTSNLLKSIQRGMGDVMLALQFAASDAHKVLVTNPVKDVTGIAAVLLETVLDVQRLQALVNHDFHRRIALLESLQIRSSAGVTAAASTAVTADVTEMSDSVLAAGFTADISPDSRTPDFFLQSDVLNSCIRGWDAEPAVLTAEDKLLLEHIVQNNAKV